MAIESSEMDTPNMPTHHSYNLRPRTSKINKKYTMMQKGEQQSTIKKDHKPLVYVLVMQMSIREGINKFRDKGNDALLKIKLDK